MGGEKAHFPKSYCDYILYITRACTNNPKENDATIFGRNINMMLHRVRFELLVFLVLEQK